MAMTFDATLKDLARERPQAFLAAFDEVPTGPVRLLNVDLSTVTALADVVIGLGEPLQEIIHLDFQGSASARKHADILCYNALLFAHYLVPVHSIVVLLRPQAAHSNLNGRVSYAARPARGSMDFGYEVVPLWTMPVEQLLGWELGAAPLAVLGRVPEGMTLADGLLHVAGRLAERLERETTPAEAKKLLTKAFLLTGLRLPRAEAREIFRRARSVDMRESDTYLAILDEGREEGIKKVLLLQGEQRFGPASEPLKTRLEAITDLDRLERLSLALLTASNWQELLDTP
jgi:hypothetical protein